MHACGVDLTYATGRLYMYCPDVNVLYMYCRDVRGNWYMGRLVRVRTCGKPASTPTLARPASPLHAAQPCTRLTCCTDDPARWTCPRPCYPY